MAAIQCTKGFTALLDDIDAQRLAGKKYYASRGSRGEYRPRRRLPVKDGGGLVYLHHDIIQPPKGMVVDHINGDPWDNRRANLRVCTIGQNVRNSGCRAGNFKGVHRTKYGRFMAHIMCSNRGFYLGTFAVEEDAARAYDTAARRLHGQFARTNFDDPGDDLAHGDHPHLPSELVVTSSHGGNL